MMCLILLAYEQHPNYALIIAANRDEFYARPSARANWWSDHPDVLAGRDLKGGGTWLGVNNKGHFAALTNIREPAKFNPEAPSRGALVSDYLIHNSNAADYIEDVAATKKSYNGYNLLLGNSQESYFSNNKGAKLQKLEAGIYGLSNDELDTPWPKVELGKRGLSNCMIHKDADSLIQGLFELLGNSVKANDDELPDTGIPIEWERRLSPMFIQSPEYGTRVSTVLLMSRSGEVQFVERSFEPEGEDLDYRFTSKSL